MLKNAARELYITSYDKLSIYQIAKKLEIDRSYLSKIAKNENWDFLRKKYWIAKYDTTILEESQTTNKTSTEIENKEIQTIPQTTNENDIAIFKKLSKSWYIDDAIILHKLKCEIRQTLGERQTNKERSQLIRDLTSIIQSEKEIYGKPDQQTYSKDEIIYIAEFGKSKWKELK